MIINLTQHTATDDQLAGGVFEPTDKLAAQTLLTFEELPTREDILLRAEALAELAASDRKRCDVRAALVGGA